PVGGDQREYARSLLDRLPDVRTDLDDSDDTLAKKIRTAEKEWIPYIVVVGKTEIESGNLNVRVRETKEHTEMSVDALRKQILARGLGLLVAAFSHALAIATAPGDFFRGQMPQQTPTGPSASFTWDTNGANATTVQDTSRQGDVAITSWNWNFGDGTRVSGQNPGSHTYANSSVYQVSL